MVCAYIFAIIAIIYILFDVNYFIRIAFTIAWGRLFRKKLKILDKATIYGICTTQDIDVFITHMNNARYLRELDFARFDYYGRSGIYKTVSRRGGSAVQSASIIRYRRPLFILTPYKVITQLVYWEDKHFYLEHQFISLSDNFIRAVISSKQTLTGLNESVSDIIAAIDPEAQQPKLSNELKLWLESIEESSHKLRKMN